jgi:hypothetical protein
MCSLLQWLIAATAGADVEQLTLAWLAIGFFFNWAADFSGRRRSAGNEDVVHISKRYAAVNRSSRDGGADSSKESNDAELHLCGIGSISSRISSSD